MAWLFLSVRVDIIDWEVLPGLGEAAPNEQFWGLASKGCYSRKVAYAYQRQALSKEDLLPFDNCPKPRYA